MSALLTGVSVLAWAAFLGAWAQMGYVDRTEQKIRNRYLGLWMKAAALGYLVLLAHSLTGLFSAGTGYLLAGYYAALGRYLLVSVLAAYALWALRIWPAGDVKLYVLLALYYPLMRIPGSFHSGLRFLEVLINVFIPAAAFLFLTAGEYLWRTRFTLQKDFLLSLGARRLGGYLAVKGAEALVALKKEMADWVAAYKSAPWRLAADAGAWLVSVAVMSMISYSLNDLIASNFLRTLVCFALFFGWSRFCQLIGRARALGLSFIVSPVLGLRLDRLVALTQAFGQYPRLQPVIFFRHPAGLQDRGGQSGFVFLPLLFMVPSLIPWHWFYALKERLWEGRRRARRPSGRPRGCSRIVGLWAAMGLFFGLALVFVKIWDAESPRASSGAYPALHDAGAGLGRAHRGRRGFPGRAFQHLLCRRPDRGSGRGASRLVPRSAIETVLLRRYRLQTGF